MMSNLQFPHNRPPVILAIDTSHTRAGFAISRGAEIITSSQSDASIPHSKIFFDLLSLLIKDSGLSLAKIDVFAAAVGPGSFTGLRVGLSAIKGILHSLSKPVVGISSIDAVALTSETTGKVLALIDAGREEFYAGLREISLDRALISLGTDIVGKLPDVIKSFNKYVMEESLSVVSHSNREMSSIDLPFNWQMTKATFSTAEEIAIYVSKNLESQTNLSLYPYYIRQSDAEIKRAS